MTIYVIGYDIHPSRGETYDDLIAAIEKLSINRWHGLDSTWLIETGKTAKEIRDALKPVLNPDDRLLVLRYGAKAAAWTGFSGSVKDWLRDNL